MKRRGIRSLVFLPAVLILSLAACQQSAQSPAGATPDAADIDAADSQPADHASTSDSADSLPVKNHAATDAAIPIDAAAAAVNVSASGYGALQFGMPRDEAEKAIGAKFDAPDKDGCQQVHRVGQSDVSYLFDGEKLLRIDVQTSAVSADGGGHVGMQADEIRTLYAGRLTEQPRKDVQGGLYLKVLDKSGSGLIFQTDASGKVTSFRGGIAPALDRAAGCS